MPKAQRRHGYDLEEITPNHFLVYNDNAHSVLRGEGERRGGLFVLTSWRREGLLGRLSTRGYQALTIERRIEQLPTLPQPVITTQVLWRPLGNAAERYSVFGPEREWQPCEPGERNGVAGVELGEGQVVRRRKSRGAADFYTVFAERAGIAGLRPLEESAALLHAYAQMAGTAAPWQPTSDGETMLLPAMPLPDAHRDLLARLGERTRESWRFPAEHWPLVREVFSHLGVDLPE